jgi:nitronate monooxygenase/enoyl-[acyl-carrier protein] reductase II
MRAMTMTISPEWKRLIVAADASEAIKDETVDALLPPYNRPAWPCRPRVLHTAFHAAWAGREAELAQLAPTLGPALVADVLQGGGHDIAPFAGQSVGLIDGIRPATEIIRGAVTQACEILG